jgi:hypothetical protein
MRGRQQRAWTWPGGCEGDGTRGGVCSAVSLLKQRETGEEGGGDMGRGGCQVEEQGGSRRPATIGHGEGGRQSGDTREGEGGEFGQVGPPGRERGGTWAGPGKGQAGQA